MTDLSEAIKNVLAERARQDTKWGEQNHDPFVWTAILVEEVGEVCQAVLHLQAGGPKANDLRNEIVQVAAVAVAMVECLDRGKWNWLPQHEPVARGEGAKP